MTNQELFDSILKKISNLSHIKISEIPNIDLYMDQVTTFMDEHLSSSKRYEDDKILTKTMINNYAKNDLLPAPSKKKYSKDHMILLIFIYYFKNILSISDIQSLLEPISDKYFQTNTNLNLEKIYDTIFSLEKDSLKKIRTDVTNMFKQSQNTFDSQTSDNEELEDLQLFSFICMLSFDVYVKKQIIEDIIDSKNSSKSKKK